MPDSPARGDPAPAFRLASTSGEVSLESLLADGSSLVLLFYFQDGTPSCQTELEIFRDAADVIEEAHARVAAVSADSVESHREFAARLGGVPFPLASDPELEAARLYGVVEDGDPRRSRRSIFVIAPEGTVRLALPHFQPNNISQVEAIFAALSGEEGG